MKQDVFKSTWLRVSMSLLLSITGLLPGASESSAQTAARPTPAATPNKRAVFSGAINSSLPSAQVPGAPKKVYFPLPNTILMSGTRFCGDGDVADYSHHSPIQFFPTGVSKTPVLLGYWIVDENLTPAQEQNLRPENSQLSTTFKQGNWFMIGWLDSMPIDTGVIHKLRRANTYVPGDAGLVPTFRLVKETLKDLVDLSTGPASSFEDNRKYRVQITAMTCKNFSNSDGISRTSGSTSSNFETNQATALAVSQQFLTGANLSMIGGTATTLSAFLTSELSGAGANSFLNSLNSVEAVAKSAAGDIKNGIRLRMNTSEGVSGGFQPAIDEFKAIDGIPMPQATIKPVAISDCNPNSGPCTCSCAEVKYADDMRQSSAYIRSRNLAQQIAGMVQRNTNCSLHIAGSDRNFSQSPYLWEPYPTNATCSYAKNMARDNMTKIKTAIDKLAEGTEAGPLAPKLCNQPVTRAVCASGAPMDTSRALPSAANFAAWKREAALGMAQVFLGPQIIKAAQASLNSKIQSTDASKKIALNLASCLPSNESGNLNYIRTVGGAYTMPMQKNRTGNKYEFKNPGRMVHPEGNLAMGGDRRYANMGSTAGDHNAVFNNTGSDARSEFKVGPGTGDITNLDSPGIHLEFNIRSIGCSQNIYCLNEKTPEAKAPLPPIPFADI